LELPRVRGSLVAGRGMADLTWLRVGGPADWLFQPADEEDLIGFLAELDPSVQVFPLGVGSNLIVRDGGIEGVVIRLGRGFNGVSVSGDTISAGSAALDARIARHAAAAGVDLAFLATIPGTLGGAARMNAGCYGRYLADVFVSARGVTRQGERVVLSPEDMGFMYRGSALPDDLVLTEATLRAPLDVPEAIEGRIARQISMRDASQPTRERSAGSTFRNPAGYSSTGLDDDTHEMKAWKLIEDAGLRGARRGGAMMSDKHANFLVNAGGATAADLEGLGEAVRAAVRARTGGALDWEVLRVGRP
jgi:UDP-N-acetylmuramate dehydrogenase